MDKRGQVAIWVIVAVIIVASILLFFLLRRTPLGVSGTEFNVESYIQTCTGNAVNEAVNKMLPQGGFLEPTRFEEYNYTNISYLCENPGFYYPCTNLHPMLIKEMTNEIENYATPRIEQCFQDVKKEVERRGGSLEMGTMSAEFSMAPRRIFVDIKRELKATQRGTTRTFDKFNVEIISPAYDLANVAIEIANSEAKYCNFEYVGYDVLYPRWDISLIALSEPNKIYVIKDRESGGEMNIAIRSCAIPIGLG